MNITRGARVTAVYTLRDEDGNLIECSADTAPLEYVHGQGTILRGIERALEGRAPGERLSLRLAPEEAFGPHRPELVFEAARANLPPGLAIAPGVEMFSGMGDRPAFSLRVVRETEDGALLDGNHPLAGKVLKVELEILEVSPPQP